MKKLHPEQLLQEAATAVERAYSPYSKYRVGAALLTSDGKIFRGCNVENASYGLTVCAERVAFFTAVATGQRQFTALAIVATPNISPNNPHSAIHIPQSPLPYPCGACRQVMAEFCGPDFPIYIAPIGRLNVFEELRLGILLPKSFMLGA